SPEADAVGIYVGGELIARTGFTAGVENRWTIQSEDKTSMLQLINADNDSPQRGGSLDAWRSRGTLGSPAAVVNGDELFRFRARGHDGTAFREVAAIIVRVDGGVGTGDLPTNMIFQVTPDGGISQVPAVTISNQGNIILREAAASTTIDANSRVSIYMKNDYIVLKYNDNGTNRYKYMPLFGTSTTWTYSATEP